MEKNLEIKTPDGKVISGILRGPITRPLIVLVHGLAGNMNEAMHYNAVRYFKKHGFSSFRFNLYSWGKKNRKMHECTLKTHGKDIDVIIQYLRKNGASKIFIVGHSYGLPSILLSQEKDFDAVVSWDGSCLPRSTFERLPPSLKPKGRILDEGYFVIMGEQMSKEEEFVDSFSLVKKLNKPIKFITAEGPKNQTNEVVGKKMFRAATVNKSFVTIKGASHNFTEDGKQEQLYKETVNWFKNF